MAGTVYRMRALTSRVSLRLTRYRSWRDFAPFWFVTRSFNAADSMIRRDFRNRSADCKDEIQRITNNPTEERRSVMQLLILLVLAGVISGSVSGAYVQGADGLILGASSGLVAGVVIWMVIGIVVRAIREYRLDRYFVQNGQEIE